LNTTRDRESQNRNIWSRAININFPFFTLQGGWGEKESEKEKKKFKYQPGNFDHWNPVDWDGSSPPGLNVDNQAGMSFWK